MNSDPAAEGGLSSPDKIVIKTGRTKYSFTKAWTENEGLNKLLVDLVADDLNRSLNNNDV